MSEQTTRLALPYLMAAQAQKHVTHNEALRLIDGLLHLTVVDRTTTSPPGSAADGDAWIVAAGATGEWAGWDGDVAMRSDGAWYRLSAVEGMRAWDQTDGGLIVRAGGAWLPIDEAIGYIARAASVTVAEGANGASTGLAVAEEAIATTSGASVTSTVVIPDRAICLGVSVRVTSAIVGPTSFDVGIAGEASKFGGALGISAGSVNRGVIGPTAFYTDTPVVLTANGADFAGGEVRLAIHTITVGASEAGA
jgi:transposase